MEASQIRSHSLNCYSSHHYSQTSSSKGFSTILKRVGVSLLLFSSMGEAKRTNIRFAFWGDQYKLSKDSSGLGGFAGLKTLFNREEPNTIRMCTGDMLYPNVLSLQDKGRYQVDILNEFCLTASILGNHELDGGHQDAQERFKESNFPWLAANAIDKNGDYFTGNRQTILLDVEGIKVGIFGLITPSSPRVDHLNNRVTFMPIIPTAEKMVKELKKQGAQLIIAGTHMELEEDELLASRVPEINGIFGGHDHIQMAKMIGRTLLIKPGQDAHYLARVRFQVETTENSDDLDIIPCSEFITNENIEEDSDVANKVAHYQEILESREMTLSCFSLADEGLSK